MDNDSFNFKNDSIPKPRYINEYRKMGDMFRLKPWKEKNFLDKLLIQIFISLIILAFVLFVNSININIAKDFTLGIKKVINWKVDFQNVRDVIDRVKTIEENKQLDRSNPSLPISSENFFIMPIEGEITSEFGQRIHPVFNTVKVHNGIDISGDYGDRIKASMAGTVSDIGEDSTLGKYVWIVNGKYKTLYAHCSKIIVETNQEVMQGDIIAEVGDTGLASGTHLHFEIWENDIPVNPLDKIKNP